MDSRMTQFNTRDPKVSKMVNFLVVKVKIQNNLAAFY